MTELNRCSRQRVRARLPESKRLTQLGCTRATTKHTNHAVRSSTVPHGPSCDPSLHAHSALLSRCSRGRAARCGSTLSHARPRSAPLHPIQHTSRSIDASISANTGTQVFASLHVAVGGAARRDCGFADRALEAPRRLRYTSGRREDDPLPQPTVTVYLWTPRGRSTSTAGDAAVGLSHSVTRARAPRCELAHAPRWVHPRRSAEARPPPCTARRRGGVPEGFRITKGSG